jgi:hypothetical protein
MLTKAEKKYLRDSELIEKLAQHQPINQTKPSKNNICTYVDQKGIQRVRPCDPKKPIIYNQPSKPPIIKQRFPKNNVNTYIDEKGIQRVRKPEQTTTNDNICYYVDQKGIQRIIPCDDKKPLYNQSPIYKQVSPKQNQSNYKTIANFEALQFHSNKLIKTAGLFEDLDFPGVASSIMSGVKNLISPDDDSPMGLLKGLGGVIASGALFKLHPILGIAYTAAKALGVDVIGVAKSVIETLIDKVRAGKSLVMDDIQVSASTYSSIIKLGWPDSYRKPGLSSIKVPFLPTKGSSMIEKVFGNLFELGKRKQLGLLLVGIIIWTIKTSLLGLGLVGIGAASKFVGDKVINTLKPSNEQSTEESEDKPTRLVEQKPQFSSSGKGEKYFKNDAAHIWVVPLINNDVEQTLKAWTNEIYPEIDNVEILPSFHSTVRLLLRNNNNKEQNSIAIPQGFNTRKQIVDLFAKDAK